MNISEMTARRIRDSVLAGEVTAEEVLDHCLERIQETEPQINAFIQVTESSARAAASKIDTMISKGENPGPLCGIPVAIKDNICVKGAVCTSASKMMENWIAPYDAHVVTLLKEQGAVIVGKTNLDEFAMGSSTETSAFGPTKNPWDVTRVPGGSSGGSAAAVASGMVPLSIGTDTGGSIRQPSSFTGICGLKPTYGLVSRYGAVAYGSSLDSIGPFGKTVSDCALAMEAISGHDPRDPSSSFMERVSYTKGLKGTVKGVTIGFPKELLSGVSPDVRNIFEKSLDTVRSMGITVKEIDIPSLKYAIGVYYAVATGEASSNLSRFDGVRFGTRAESETSDEMYALSRGRGFGYQVIKRILLGTFVLGAGQKDEYYVRAAKIRTLIREDFNKVFEECDFVLSPAAPFTAFKLGEIEQDPAAVYTGDLLSVPVNLAGLPALSMPMGLVESNGICLPCGLQIIGKPFDDISVLKLGCAFEQETEGAFQERAKAMRRSIGAARECELVD